MSLDPSTQDLIKRTEGKIIMSIDILKNDLKSGKLRSLYLFYGNEDYLKNYYLKNLEEALLQKDTSMMNKSVFEGKTDANSIIDTCETIPVFSEKRIVIVKNSSMFKPKKKKATDDEYGEMEIEAKPANNALQTFLEDVPQHCCLVFFETEIDKRLKIVDIIKKKGLIVEFAFQSQQELIKWVIKVFKASKIEIDVLTASQLVDNCEFGMNELLNEINKVINYVEDRTKVTSKDIDDICIKSIKGRIFDLIDAIAEKKAIKALKLLDNMLILREPLPKIIFMIAKQFRSILSMKLLTEEGLTASKAAAKMKLSPYAISKVVKQANGFTEKRLKEALKQMQEYDVSIKTGKINDRLAVELFIAEFSK